MIKLLTFLTISGINDRMSSEKNTKTPERNKKPNYTLRRLGALGLIGVTGVVGGAGIVHATAGKSVPKNPSEIAMEYGGYVDNGITSITIDKGANLRSDPADGDDDAGMTNLIKTTNETIRVKADNDITVSQDINGTWYGVPAESLNRVDPDLKVKGNSDGYIYVNDQRAIPHESTK